MSSDRDLLLVFGTIQRVTRAERIARKHGLDVEVVPAPRVVSTDCGMVLQAWLHKARHLLELLEEQGLGPSATWRRHENTWLPTSLDSPPTPPKVALTRESTYGGCGAKLSQGLLSSILCGLPRVQSDDLLVGIDLFDDAGVVRVADDLAIIHTTDFFPPPVDDPFSFGRIAAANALSDVYAMGGAPLGAMNLVSFPLEQLGKAALKEILRGGLSGLQEADALLLGGHTIQGDELLYGMAVTGLVHPDHIWRNTGARAGDLLVLTKPLGTSLITTAARAELADSGHLAMAIRWMSTLNRRAAEVAREVRVHAATDVTGFGLVGHAAELAEASQVGIEIQLNQLPVLPGAREAAAMGLVPMGTSKNRKSLAEVLELTEGCDELAVDIALDPQTSGGLLLACEPDQARALAQKLPAAAVIGRCVAAPAGHLILS